MAHFLNGENYCDELVHVHNLGVWDPGETGFENKYWLQQVHRWEKVQKIIKLLYGQEMVQRQHSYKNTPLIPSEFTHESAEHISSYIESNFQESVTSVRCLFQHQIREDWVHEAC